MSQPWDCHNNGHNHMWRDRQDGGGKICMWCGTIQLQRKTQKVARLRDYDGDPADRHVADEIQKNVARIATLEAVLTKISKMNTGEWSREDMAAVARDALPLS